MKLIAAALLAGLLGPGPALAAAPDCDGPPPPLALDKITARAILVGELHGTAEVPAFVAQLVCGLLKSGRPVILALERDGSEQVALNRYLASAGSTTDVQALIRTGAWAQPFQDGRSSQAMLALIEQMRQWKQAGQRVGVLAMQLETHEIVPADKAADRPAPTTPTDADAARSEAINDRTMADKLWTTLMAHPRYTVVALAGNLHTALGARSRAQWTASPSVADVLASYVPVYVIGLNSSGGTSWIALPGSAPGAQPVMAQPLYFEDSRIDARVELGKVTASPPAASLGRSREGAGHGSGAKNAPTQP
jgi:hypothetical protein